MAPYIDASHGTGIFVSELIIPGKEIAPLTTIPIFQIEKLTKKGKAWL